MKKIAKKCPKSTGFFNDPRIKKIMSDPRQKADIDSKYHYLEFLEEIEKIRKAEGLSQIALAKLTRISQMELSRIERGKRNITFETYFKILNSMGYEAKIEFHKIHGIHA